MKEEKENKVSQMEVKQQAIDFLGITMTQSKNHYNIKVFHISFKRNF